MAAGDSTAAASAPVTTSPAGTQTYRSGRAAVGKGVEPAGRGDVNRGPEEEQPGQAADRGRRRGRRENDRRAERARTEGHRAPEPGASLAGRCLAGRCL